MTTRTHFVLDTRTVLHHRAGRTLAFDPSSIGQAFPIVTGAKAAEMRPVSGPHSNQTVVAVVPIMGPLSQRADTYCGWVDGYDSITERVCSALNDPSVAGVVLQMDSPGGDVAGIEEAIRAITEVRDASGKPVAVYVDEMAASGAYWLAATLANAGIYCPQGGFVGSVGCYHVFVDETKALEQEGVSIKLIRDPAGKAAEAPMDPVPDLAIARIQSEVSAIANRFFAAVASARGVSADAVRSLNAAMLNASAALAAHLIDGIDTLDGVVAKVAEKARANAEAKRPAARTSIVRPVHAATNTRRVSAAAVSRPTARLGGKIMPRTRAADEMAPPGESDAPANGGRSTAAEVAQSCTDCATSCTDCATACENGTADEAISSATACMEACEKNIATLQSFLGMSATEAPPPAAEPPPPEDAAAVSQMLRVTGKASRGEALVEIERWKDVALAQHAAEAKVAADRAKLEGEERRSLVAQLVKTGFETPATAWADADATQIAEPLASMSMPALRERVAKLTSARVPASTPRAPARVEGSADSSAVPARIVEGWRNKGLKGEALNRACAEYLKTNAAINSRKGQ